MEHPCYVCDAPSRRRCSGCKIPRAWYCSEKCQRLAWTSHVFECNPSKPIKTCYYLGRAVYRDVFPDDPQTLEDYGFTKAFTQKNRTMLLGLYQGLIKYMDVDPKTIHMWRRQGTLIEEIKAAFERLPEDGRGGYYQWFLRNQWVLDSTLQPPTDGPYEVLSRSWQYACGSPPPTLDEINAAREGWPESKQDCFSFCALTLSNWHPSPELKIWITFGFCICRDEHSESSLGRLYEQLLARCSFHELHNAYKSSALIALFDAKGLNHERKSVFRLEDLLYAKPERESFRLLEDILAGSPIWNKSVWNLKQYVMVQDYLLIPSVRVDYGFDNCKGEAEGLELREVYKQLFDHPNVDPLQLHEAAIGGRLFDYVGGFLTLKKKFKRLMKNPYPLVV